MESNKAVCRTIISCRSCGHKDLQSVLSLGDLYVSNFLDAEAGSAPEAAYPLELVLCIKESGGCGLLQLRHTVSAQAMYRNYWYRSGVNKTMTEALADLAHTAQDLARPRAGEVLVDIGCNDGTLLRQYRADETRRVGFEPAENLLSEARAGGAYVVNDFFSAAAYRRVFGSQQARIITAVAMFYDLDDPNAFVADVADILAPDGILVIQMSYLPAMLVQNAFDNICHEHLEYYGLGSLVALLNRHKLEVFDATLNDVNGGSFRIFVRHAATRIGGNDEASAGRIAALRQREEEMQLDQSETYNQFAKRARAIREQTRNFIIAETQKGKRVYGYGASTKGNTLLQYFALDHTLVTAVAERNPIKWGKKTIGTNIPIVSEEAARAEKPDYFLILPWHFLPEFLEREKDWRAAGGKFIVPLPEFRVV